MINLISADRFDFHFGVLRTLPSDIVNGVHESTCGNLHVDSGARPELAAFYGTSISKNPELLIPDLMMFCNFAGCVK